MSNGIPRAPIYPRMPKGEVSGTEVESVVAWQNIDEHRQLVTELFGYDTDAPYKLTPSDLEAGHQHKEMAKKIGHFHSRSAHEIGTMVLATVKQMEDEVREQTMLDIGCGTGRLGEAMARNAHADVTFLDNDPVLLKQIPRRLGKTVLADALDIPFDDESFQKVFNSYSSVHWAEDPAQSVQALNEAVRVTEVGGTTIVIPIINNITSRRDFLAHVLKDKTPEGNFKREDSYVVVWALQDLAVTKALYRLAEEGLVEITWSGITKPTRIDRVNLEFYSAVIDKLRSVPKEVLADNLAEAQAMIKPRPQLQAV